MIASLTYWDSLNCFRVTTDADSTGQCDTSTTVYVYFEEPTEEEETAQEEPLGDGSEFQPTFAGIERNEGAKIEIVPRARLPPAVSGILPHAVAPWLPGKEGAAHFLFHLSLGAHRDTRRIPDAATGSRQLEGG